MLSSKIKHDIEKNHTHKVVAAITFTIKAAAEIKDRLNMDYNELRLRFIPLKGWNLIRLFYLHRIIDWQRNKIFATTMLRLHERNQN